MAARRATSSRCSARSRSSTSRRPMASRWRKRRGNRSPETRTSATSPRSRRSQARSAIRSAQRRSSMPAATATRATSDRGLVVDRCRERSRAGLGPRARACAGRGYAEYGREVAEVIVETATVSSAARSVSIRPASPSLHHRLGRAGSRRDPPARREGRRDRPRARDRLRGVVMERLVRIALKARAVGIYLVLGASSVSELRAKLRSDARCARSELRGSQSSAARRSTACLTRTSQHR